MIVKRIAKSILGAVAPNYLRRHRAKANARALELTFLGKSARDVFSLIYETDRWGGGKTGRFYSGNGSHDEAVVATYVSAMRGLFGAFGTKLDAVDLGCGDFHVGDRLRDLFGRYIACDIVPELIEHNRRVFAGRDVEFCALDMIVDALPAGEVVTIRQVLQHLSNAQIAQIVPKLRRYKYVVLTEHLSSSREFMANIDKPTGSDIRIAPGIDSGIVLTDRPFKLRPLEETILCEVPSEGGVIRTTLYRMR